MKKIYLLLLVALTVAACQKDPLGGSGTLRITAEGMHGASKVAVSGNVSYWASDDQVLVNGEQLTVNIDEPNNTVTVNYASSFEGPFFGVYPAGIYVSNSGADYTLNLPSTYTYATTTHYGRTLQNLPSPMVAYLATAGDNPVLEFKHVTGALNVMVINHYGFTIQVDSIVVSSNKYQLCGSKTVTLGNTLAVNAVDTNDAALRRVKLVGGTALRVLAGDTAIIQVPVLPVGADNRFTVEVGVQKVDQSAVKKVFSKTQGNAGSDYSLDRAEIGYVPTRFGGLFTINARGKKVIISQGNLQYDKTTGEWSFMTTQYGRVETVNQNVGDNYSSQNIVSLFGWGTSGWNNGNYSYQPYKTDGGSTSSSIGYGYGPTNGSSYEFGLTGDYKNSDWGVYNKISNGGEEEGRWRTMTGNESGEFYYLLHQRTTTTSGLPGTNSNNANQAKYIKGKIGSVCGLFIFPDNYSHPNDIGLTTSTPAYNQHASTYDYNRFIVTETNWYKMEALGVVFLPAAGYRDGRVVQKYGDYGVYWSSSTKSASTAFSLYFINDGNSSYYSSKARNLGCSVRLVHDMN